jgi:hypothetical protein
MGLIYIVDLILYTKIYIFPILFMLSLIFFQVICSAGAASACS